MNEDLILARLRRCDLWTETHREHGFIYLVGVAHNRFDVMDMPFPQHVLLKLLETGQVECSTQQRIIINAMSKQVEVTVNYWKAV